MIDLHCHLAYGVDDGPKEAADSLALARALVDAGVTEVACTPHIRADKGWLNTAETQEGIHLALDEVLDAAKIPLKRRTGAEHYLDETLMREDFADAAVPFGQSKYLLVELPYRGEPPDLFGLLFRIRRAGFRLLLAHLERFPYVCDKPDRVRQLMEAGYLIQVNLGSLAGAHGRDHKKAAERLVKSGAAAVACGDCHHADDVKRYVIKGQKALRKLVGDGGVERMTQTLPARILDDAAPEQVWTVDSFKPEKARWP